MSQQRDINLDVLKGIGILLVVLGHIVMPFHHWIYLFHMPIFFIVLGCLRSSKYEIDVKRPLLRVMWPYLTFSFLSFFYWLFIESKFRTVNCELIDCGLDPTFQQFLNIFYAGCFKNSFVYNIVLWFLPCYFVVTILYEVIKHLSGRMSVTIIGVLCITTLYIVVRDSIIVLPWALDRSLLVLPFASIGDVFYKNRDFLLRSKVYMWLAVLVSLIAFICLGLKNGVDIYGGIIGKPINFYFCALFAFIFLYCMADLCLHKISFFKWFGKNSLILMLVHEPLIRIAVNLESKILSLDKKILFNDLFYFPLTFVFVLLLSVLATKIVNSKLQFLIRMPNLSSKS